MAANKADSKSFVKYPDKLRRSSGKAVVVVYNSAYHNTKRVRRYLERNSVQTDVFAAVFAVPECGQRDMTPKAKICLTFQRSALVYFRRKAILAYELLEINFNPRDILLRGLDKLYPTRKICPVICCSLPCRP